MKLFEIGGKYYDTSACDHNCVFVVEIVKRTAKTVTYRRNGQERRAKIYTDAQGEYIMPDRYSMAPVFRACREYAEAPVEAAPAPELQAAPTAIAAVGQRVVCVCGAMYAPANGVIAGFAEQEATRFSPAAVMARIRWEDGREEYEELSQIHPLGWRSANGSPLGVFFAR